MVGFNYFVGYYNEKELAAYKETGADMVTAQALLKMGENAGKIGNLTITSDILAGIMNGVRAEK